MVRWQMARLWQPQPGLACPQKRGSPLATESGSAGTQKAVQLSRTLLPAWKGNSTGNSAEDSFRRPSLVGGASFRFPGQRHQVGKRRSADFRLILIQLIE